MRTRTCTYEYTLYTSSTRKSSILFENYAARRGAAEGECECANVRDANFRFDQ